MTTTTPTATTTQPATPAPTTIPAYAKSISYDRETRDYAMYLDGELIGFARTYHAGEVTLDQLVFELLAGEASSATTQAVDAGHPCTPSADALDPVSRSGAGSVPATPHAPDQDQPPARLPNTLAGMDAAAIACQQHVQHSSGAGVCE